ncbi:uncharacterized protein LOC141716833 [Apium graveolens]|uniref:uncharacterized protein LOC141716833 n=1 Tax=Apium graveolens TaxID=4045 RepID=UPI003D78DC12
MGRGSRKKKQAIKDEIQLHKKFKQKWQVKQKELNSNRDAKMESGSQCSQKLAKTSVPLVPFEISASDLPAARNLAQPEINKEIEFAEIGSQCSQDLTTSSVPQVLPEWVPELDDIDPSANEKEAGLTFESLYNSLLRPDGRPSLLYPKYRRLQVFKDIVDETEFMPVPKTKENTGRKTESSSHASQCSQDLSTSFVPTVLPDQVPQMDQIHPSDKELEAAGILFGSFRRISLHEDGSPRLLNPRHNSHGSRELSISSKMKLNSNSSYVTDQVSQMDHIRPFDKELEAAGIFFGSFRRISLHEDGSPPLLNPHHSSHGSRESTISSMPNKTVKQSTSPTNLNSTEEFVRVPNRKTNNGRKTENSSPGSQVFTIFSVPEKSVKNCTRPPDLKSKEFPAVSHTNDSTTRKTVSSSHGSQELAISSVQNRTVKHCTSPPDITPQKELPLLPEKNKNTGKEPAESGSQVSQELGSSAPSKTVEIYANNLPAEENMRLPKINKETGKETEVTESGSQCSQDLSTSSVPKVLPDQVHQLDHIHLSDEELEAGPIFRSFHDAGHHRDGSPPLQGRGHMWSCPCVVL